jgi:hypothetical protein
MPRVFLAASLASAATVAFDIAGRATRDSLFLAEFGAHALPLMVIGGSAVALIGGLAAARQMVRRSLVPLIRGMLLVSAGVLLLEWGLFRRASGPVAILMYVHYTALSGLFISGFWTAVSERFDPRAMRRTVTRLAAAGTAGGVVGGIVAEQIALRGSIAQMFPVLVGLNIVAALAFSGIRPASASVASMLAPPIGATEEIPIAPRIGRLSSYVRLLLALVVLCAVIETLLDFVFMSAVRNSYAAPEALLRAFTLFYTGAAILTLATQLAITRRAIDTLGLANTAAALPLATLVGGIGALAWPGIASAGIARGLELLMRNSTFRAAYEVLFNALHPREKRGAKVLVDVTALRIGRIAGSILVQAVLLALPGHVAPVLLLTTVALSFSAIAGVSWIHRGYLRTLEANLTMRAGPDADRNAALDTGLFAIPALDELVVTGPFTIASDTSPLELIDATIARLASDATARHSLQALAKIAPTIVPQLATALLDWETPFAVRRRVALVLAGCPTVPARDALVQGLADPRFEVRYRCGRALRQIADVDPTLAPPAETIIALVMQEVAVDERVWNAQRLVPLLPDERHRELFGQVLQERTDRSLEHVFTLLSLSLPAEPLRAAFRTLQGNDHHLRGTALDYLELIVPTEIRTRLWHLIERDGRSRGAGDPAPGDAVAAVIEDNQSLAFRVADLRRELDAPDD